MAKKLIALALVMTVCGVTLFAQSANQLIRELTALAGRVNDYRADMGVLTFEITDKTVDKVLNAIRKNINAELYSQKIDNPMFFPAYAGMYAGECNVTISYNPEKSGRKRGIEIFHPRAKLYYSTPEGYFNNRKLPGE